LSLSFLIDDAKVEVIFLLSKFSANFFYTPFSSETVIY